jgi:hypothetical protein
MVIRRSGQQHRIGAIPDRIQRGGRQRRGRIAAGRLQQQGPARQSEFAQLFRGDEAVFLVADDDRRGQRQAFESAQGVLQQAFAAQQGLQLLGMLFARNGPQPRSGTSAENNRHQQ